MAKNLNISVFIRKKKMKKTNIKRYYLDIRYPCGKRYNRTLNIFANKHDNRHTNKILEKIRKEVYLRLNNGESLEDVLSDLNQSNNKNTKQDFKVLKYINNLSKKITIPDYETIVSTLKNFSIHHLKHSIKFSFKDIDTDFLAGYRLYLSSIFEPEQADIIINTFLNILSYAERDKKIDYNIEWENII